jgi:hypothetical protein
MRHRLGDSGKMLFRVLEASPAPYPSWTSPPRRIGALVSQPQSNYAKSDTGLEQMHCCRMPDGMRRDAPFGETTMHLGCSFHGDVEALRDVATRHGMTVPVWQQCGICP